MKQICLKLTKSWRMLGSLLLLCFLTAFTPMYAQSITVQGTVSDPIGPALGATVLEKGTSNGAVTDLEGKYQIKVSSKNAILVFSYVGLQTQEVAVDGRTVINVTLQENEMLEEVVVVGYGVQKKSDITGSVASVDKARLEKLPVTNVLQAIQGASAGITISQSSSIPGDAPAAQVRGNNSINASGQPYIVVDGVPINNTGGSLNDIAASDIESVEILKDASATAIYGTNGSNGVILITTKHGKNGAPKVKYSGYIGWETFSNKLEFCNGEQMIQRYKDYCAQNAGETMYNDYVKYANEWENYQSGTEIDWVYDVASQTGIISDNNVSISGGTDKVRYFVSGDFMDQRGVLKGYNYKRYTMRTNIDADVTSYLTIGTNSSISSHNRDGGRVNFLNAQAMSPYGKLYEDDGSYCIYPMYSESLWANPMINTTEDVERRQWNININGFATLKFGKIWAPLEGLNYKFNAGYSYAPTRNSSYSGAEANDNNGTGYIFNSETQAYTIENILSYAKDFGKNHIDVTALYAASRKKYNQSSAQGVGFINDDLSYYSLGAASTASVGSYSDLYTTVSQMGRINYSYDSRYLATVTVRRDGSSVFGEDNKYGVFPSVALGWNFANENFMESTRDWLDNAKLRLSYGKTGNEAIGVYTTQVKMSTVKFAMGGANVVGLNPSSYMGNNELSWESTKTFNAGLDFGVLNNRLTGTVDVYASHTNDLLLKRNLPDLSGYSTVWANMGEVKSHGFEITLNSKNITTRNFSWSTGLVYSWNADEIVDLYGDKQDDLGNRWFIGEPIGVIYDYDMVGIWQEDEIANGEHLDWDPEAEAGDVKLADRDGDGDIDADDKHVKGQTAPKWTGGLTNTFTYKGISLSIFISTVQGLRKYNSLLSTASDEMGRRNMTTEVGYWTSENQSNKYRSLSKTSNRHGYGFDQDASFTRLKDVTLSYTLPKALCSKAHLSDVMVYFSGRNLYTWTGWTGWDPESRQIGRGSSSTDEYGNSVSWEDNYPMTKSFTIGLNVTF